MSCGCWRWAAAVAAGVAVATGGCTGVDDDGVPGEPFMVVALPDTQVYAEDYPEIFEAQTQWVADHADELNIEFVTHLGDVVDNGPDEEQWANGRAALAILEDAGVRYGVAMGNHDQMYSTGQYQYGSDVDSSCSSVSNDMDCDGTHYLANAGPLWIEDEGWFGEASPSGMSHWSSFERDGFEWMFLHLQVDPMDAERTWAQGVLEDHPEALVHLTTHRYLYDYRLTEEMPEPLSLFAGGRYNAAVHMLGGQELYHDEAISADELFETLVAPYANVYMVQCGHVDSEYRQASDNAAGLEVVEIMTDFQTFHPDGGDGWMKLLTYDPDASTIHVQTYSPTQDRYRENGDGLDVSLVALEQGLNWFGSELAAVGLDIEELEALIEWYTTTEEGRQSYFDAAYGDGQRDSDFVVDVDFAAYATAR